MKRIGFYSGSFDPVTLGHTDVIARACRLVDTLVIGIGVHDAKPPLFDADERIAMLQAETKPIAKTGTASRSSPSPVSPSTPRARPAPASSSVGCAMAPTSTTKCRWPA